MSKAANRLPGRRQLGDFWLWYRQDRDEWCICWYDRSARSRRRIGTGVGGGSPDAPPIEAEKALAAHFERHNRPVAPAPAGQALVSTVFAQWLEEHVHKLARASIYASSVAHWERFFAAERGAGRIGSAVSVEDLFGGDIVDRMITFRLGEGVKGETIRGDLAALSSALNYARKRNRLREVPFIPDVDAALRSGPKELEYSMEQVAGLLEAAWRLQERHHVHLFTLISLSTHGRTEAILELEASQVRDGLIYFNPSGRMQTKKRRSTVPVAPSLRPWLAGASGKIIRYQTLLAKSSWADPAVPEYHERACCGIRKAFDACLMEAGIRNPHLGLRVPLLDRQGRQREKVDNNGGRELMWRGLGSPNTLRHTLHTYLQTVGVPQAQIDAAAGHSSERGSGRNYTHLRPEYLKDFIAAVEAYWREMDGLTKVHRLPISTTSNRSPPF